MPEIVDIPKPKFNWKLTAKAYALPVLYAMGIAGAGALVEILSALQFPVGSVETLAIGAVIALIQGSMNYYKNKDK